MTNSRYDRSSLRLFSRWILLPFLSIIISTCLFANDMGDTEYTERDNNSLRGLLAIYPQTYEPARDDDFDWKPTSSGFRIRESKFYRFLGDNLKADLVLSIEKAREDKHNAATLLYFAYCGVAAVVGEGGSVLVLNGQKEKNEGTVIGGVFCVTVGVVFGFTSLLSLLAHSVEDYDTPRVYSRKDADTLLEGQESR